MTASLHLVGASHRSAPLATRERFAAPRGERIAALRDLAERLGSAECFWVATCNRAEMYAWGPADSVAGNLAAEVATLAGFTPAEAAAALYSKQGAEAVRHLFRVAAGLDSLVVGETQILGQLRQARADAEEAGTLGPRTTDLLRRAIRTGRRVRLQTGINRGAGSVSSAAIRLAQTVCGDLQDKTVLLIGAGEVAELVARALAGAGARQTLLVNRTHHRAETLARRFGGRAHPYEQTPKLLAQADIVISSTDAPHPVVRRRTLEAVRAGSGRPLCVIDLAVPRDVEPDVATLPDVHVYNVDDLQMVVDRDLAGRAADAAQAESVVLDAVREYEEWLAALRVGPDVRDFRERAHAIRLQELARWQRRLGELEPKEREEVAALTRAIVNKILHQPSVRLKQSAALPHGAAYRESLRDLFALDEPLLGPD